MIFVSYALSLAAIVVMIVNTYLAFKLRRAMIGGEVGDRWRLLTNLIVIFLVGYVLSPLLLVFNATSRWSSWVQLCSRSSSLGLCSSG